MTPKGTRKKTTLKKIQITTKSFIRKNLSLSKRIKRDKIVDAARLTFQELGYKKTTMNDIARASGKGKSSIYYYFDSKEHIFKSVVLNEAVLYRQKVLEAINKNETPYDKIKTYIMVRMQTDRILHNFHTALNDPELRYIEYVDRLKKLYDKEEYRLFRRILQSGIDSGYFEIYDIKNAAIGIVNAMRGIEHTLLLNPEDPNREKKVEIILNIVLYGIVKR